MGLDSLKFTPVDERVVKSVRLTDRIKLKKLRQRYPDPFDTLKPGWTALIQYRGYTFNSCIVFVNSLNRVHNAYTPTWIAGEEFLNLIVSLFYGDEFTTAAFNTLRDKYKSADYVKIMLVLKMDNSGVVHCDYTFVNLRYIRWGSDA